MVKGNHSGLLEDSRFKEIKRLKKKNLPHQLHWYLKEDYLTEELLGIYASEVMQFTKTANEAFSIFQKATDRIIERNELHLLGIPKWFEACIIYSWENRKKHPFLAGRFDLNEGFNNTRPKVIEFNADTFSTLPETLLWQPIQLEHLGGGFRQYDTLKEDISKTLSQLKAEIGNSTPNFLASTFGYQEDVINANCLNVIAHDLGFNSHYCHLEKVTFSEDEGIFYNIGEDYKPVDLWYKMIPWDWMFTDEPELAKLLSTIILKDLCIVLNPPYTTIWQNKKFLAYITEHFPNNAIAETFLKAPSGAHVSKPMYGRLGENITIHGVLNTNTSGDYKHQEQVFQNYYPLAKDEEDYYYQTGVWYTHRTSGINLRTQNKPIITDDCEFMSHFLL